MTLPPLIPCITLLALTAASLRAADPAVVNAEITPDGLRLLIDGQLFTQYRTTDAQRPYLYPLIGPSGAGLTRPFPMEPGGEEDHPHHRSFWFAHGAVNGIDCWADGADKGRQRHLGVSGIELQSGSAQFHASTQWLDPDGEELLRDQRRIRIEADRAGRRVVDFFITLEARSGEVTLGDTKEGTFALRLAPTLRVQGEQAQGSYLSSEGLKNGKVWGTRAAWMAASGPDAKGQEVTLVIFDHPRNLRHPTWWHARTYGLMAANPFGQHDFEKLDDKKVGDWKMRAGDKLSFFYRVLILPGSPQVEAISAEFEAFSKIEP